VALPSAVVVKISSEAAGYVSMTPVARRELPLAELVEKILAVTGKQPQRIHEILRRGTIVSDGARFRWQGLSAEERDIAELLAAFPDADPNRSFAADRCVRVVLRGARTTIELEREAALRKRLFRRRGYWDEMLPALTAAGPVYRRYSYRDRADVYECVVDAAVGTKLREKAQLLAYSALAAQVERLDYDVADLYVER